MSSQSMWHSVPVAGGLLQVMVAGQGPAVLLVHGFPDDHRVWRHQVPALVAAGYQVIVPDMRGCGGSFVPERTADFRLPVLIDDLRTVLDHLNVTKARVIGHDWGAVITWQFVMAHPARVICHIALSVGHPLAYATDGLMQKLRGWYALMFQLHGLAEVMLRARNWALFRFIASQPGENEGWIARLSRPDRLTAALRYYRANLVNLLVRRRYPPVVVPVLGLWSTGDVYLTERQMLRSREMVSAAWSYARIEHASHWLQLEQPELVNAQILKFLEIHHD